MLGLVPLAYFALGVLIVRQRRLTASWRSACLASAVIWGLTVTAITEGLSLINRLGRWEAVVLWLRAKSTVTWAGVRQRLAGLSGFERGLLISLAVIISVVGLTGWVAAPNTHDSLSYHLSRVMHWAQNHSVAFYPTHITRQLHQSPWAEFASLQFQLLTGSDRWAAGGQWFSLVGAAVAVSLLAQQLGAERRGQLFAAAMAVCVPMGVLQGSSTQNDYVLTFWLTAFVYYALRLLATARPALAAAAGASLGLAILTKPTAYLLALPFVVWVGVGLLRTVGRRAWLAAGLCAVLILAINAGHYTRNLALYGSPLGPGEELGGYRYANDTFSVGTTFSNVMRNVALHLGTPSEAANAAVEEAIRQLHRAVGLDADAPGTTWLGTTFQVRYGYSENEASNGAHLALGLVTLLVLLRRWRRPPRAPLWYAVCLVAGFVLFCFYLRWQPWNSRLHLPLFVLGAAPAGLLLGNVRPARIANYLVVIVLVAANTVGALVLNPSRPFIGPRGIFALSRSQGYFAADWEYAEPYLEAAQYLASHGCSQIGLMLGGDDIEYPLWPLLAANGLADARLEHVNVTNLSAALVEQRPYAGFRPCAVLLSSASPPATVPVGGEQLAAVWAAAPLSIYAPAAAANASR